MMTSWGGGGVTASSPNYYSDYSNSASSVSSAISSSVFSPDSSTFTTLDKNVGTPYLEVIEQTASQFRFRYKSEMQGTHGAIQGIKSTKKNKTFPSVRLCNYNGPATIRCTLYTADKKSLHVHRLVGKSSGKEKDDPHDTCVGPHLSNGYVARFQNLVIIHVAKKHLVNELLEKKKRVIQANYPNIQKFPFTEELLAQLEKEAREETKKMDMNCAVLRYEALIFENDCYVPLRHCEPIYSSSIKNLKCHVHGQLRICRMDKVSGSCEGDEEIFLLVEKVGKDNIRVVMTEYDDYHREVWSDYCRFTATDVHHQFAIVCRTPKYRFTNIKEKVSVDIQLERISDLARSEPREFLYLPDENCHYQVTDNNKRKRVAATSPALSVGSNDQFKSPHPYVTSTTADSPVTKPLLLPEVCSVQNVYAPFPNDNMQSAIWIPDHVVLPNDESMLINEQPVITNMDDEMSAEKSISITKLLSSLPTPDVSDIYGFFTANDLKKNDPIPFTNPQGQIPVCENWLGFDGGEKGYILLDDDDDDEEEVHDNQHITQDKEDKNKQNKENETILAAVDLASLIIGKLNDLPPHGNNISQIIDKIMRLCSIKGNSALHTAVIHKQTKELSSLVSFLQLHNKTDHLNCYNSAHQTPLHLAVSGGEDKDSVEIVNVLLDAGADPSRVDTEGRTPLHIAVRSNFKDIITSLLESPLIEVNDVNDNDGTALHIAAEKGLIEVAELLLEDGADVNSINKKTGRTPLHCAVINKNMDVVSLLLSQENVQIDKEDFNGYNPLQLSILDECQPWKKIFKKLIKHGATFDNDKINNMKSNDDNQRRESREKILENGNEDICNADLLLKQFFELSIEH